MSHKIESSRNPLVLTSVRSKSPSVSQSTTPAGAAPTDSLRVTDHARLAARVIQTARETPDIDTQRVSTVSKAIDNGSYVVNAAMVATRMLQQEWQLST